MSEWILQATDFETLLEGLVILGTGGGGSSEWGRMILHNEFQQGRTMWVIDPNDLPNQAQVYSGGIMGSVKALEAIPLEEMLVK
jgi:uncharacterized protein